MNKLKILTLNWNGEDKLKNLVPSLFTSLKDLDYEWFVRDNGSTDNSISFLNSLENSNIKIIAHKNNLSNFAQGMNHLFLEASPDDKDFILLLNNDIVFNDVSSIRSMINILEKDESVGVVGTRLLYSGTDRLQHGGVVFNPNFKMPVHFRWKEKTDKNAERNREFQAITAAVMLTKAEHFRNTCKTNKSGNPGMDENFVWAFEDTSMCLSIRYEQGKKIVYCGKTNISHEESATLKKMPQNKLFMSHNRNYFLNKWEGIYKLDQEDYTRNPKQGVYER